MMAEQQKRLSPQELRQRQQEIERVAREEKARTDAEVSAAVEEKRQREIRAALDRVTDTWRDGAEEAFQKPEVRFVVVAKVNRDGRQAALEFLNVIGREGFVGEIVTGVVYPDEKPGQVRQVNRGRELGWCLGDIPTIGSGAPPFEESLIVRLPPT